MSTHRAGPKQGLYLGRCLSPEIVWSGISRRSWSIHGSQPPVMQKRMDFWSMETKDDGFLIIETIFWWMLMETINQNDGYFSMETTSDCWSQDFFPPSDGAERSFWLIHVYPKQWLSMLVVVPNLDKYLWMQDLRQNGISNLSNWGSGFNSEMLRNHASPKVVRISIWIHWIHWIRLVRLS